MITSDITLIFEDKDIKKYSCPICGAGEIAIRKNSDKSYGYCDMCTAAYIDYEPEPHQMDIHNDTHKIKMLLGGMGSGKTTPAVIDIIDHGLQVPFGRTIMMAQTLKQLSKGVMPVFHKFLPDKFIARWTDTKNDISILLTNGHEIIGFSSDDEEKFRTLDISAFYIEEASGIKPDLYLESIRRLRHPAGMRDGYSYYLGIVASNPAQGFIRDLLFSASEIYGSKSIASVVKDYKNKVINPNPDLAAFLSSSRDNTHLPAGFLQSVINSLTPAQVSLYVDCIIAYAEGAVYPDFLNFIVDDFDIPKDWTRILAHDPGYSDPAAVLLGAIDPITLNVYFYKEYYERGKSLTEVAIEIKKMIADIPAGMLSTMLIDPASNKGSAQTTKTYRQQMMIEHNLIFKVANNSLVDGIQKVRDLMYNKKLFFFRSLVNTINEGTEYRYPTPDEKRKNTNLGENPLDKDNHLMDDLRYIAQELPYTIANMQRTKVNTIDDVMANLYREAMETMQSNKARIKPIANSENMGYNRNVRKNKKTSGGFRI